MILIVCTAEHYVGVYRLLQRILCEDQLIGGKRETVKTALASYVETPQSTLYDFVEWKLEERSSTGQTSIYVLTSNHDSCLVKWNKNDKYVNFG